MSAQFRQSAESLEIYPFPGVPIRYRDQNSGILICGPEAYKTTDHLLTQMFSTNRAAKPIGGVIFGYKDEPTYRQLLKHRPDCFVVLNTPNCLNVLRKPGVLGAVLCQNTTNFEHNVTEGYLSTLYRVLEYCGLEATLENLLKFTDKDTFTERFTQAVILGCDTNALRFHDFEPVMTKIQEYARLLPESQKSWFTAGNTVDITDIYSKGTVFYIDTAAVNPALLLPLKMEFQLQIKARATLQNVDRERQLVFVCKEAHRMVFASNTPWDIEVNFAATARTHCTCSIYATNDESTLAGNGDKAMFLQQFETKLLLPDKNRDISLWHEKVQQLLVQQRPVIMSPSKIAVLTRFGMLVKWCQTRLGYTPV